MLFCKATALVSSEVDPRAARNVPSIRRWRGHCHFCSCFDWPASSSFGWSSRSSQTFLPTPEVFAPSTQFDHSTSEFTGGWWTGSRHGRSPSVWKGKERLSNRVRSTTTTASYVRRVSCRSGGSSVGSAVATSVPRGFRQVVSKAADEEPPEEERGAIVTLDFRFSLTKAQSFADVRFLRSSPQGQSTRYTLGMSFHYLRL